MGLEGGLGLVVCGSFRRGVIVDVLGLERLGKRGIRVGLEGSLGFRILEDGVEGV